MVRRIFTPFWATHWRTTTPVGIVTGGDAEMARTVEVPEYEVHERVPVDPSRAALLVIDMQNDFVKEGGTLVIPDAEATLPRIAQLLELARQARMRSFQPGHA
jgi:isochorismate hydrolase